MNKKQREGVDLEHEAVGESDCARQNACQFARGNCQAATAILPARGSGQIWQMKGA